MSAGLLVEKVFFFGIGGTLLVLCGLLSIAWPIVFFNKLEQQLVLTNESKSYNLWKETPIPMYMNIYMFNLTNPEESLNKGAIPHFVEMGPYVFSEKHKKVDIEWNKNNTISFKQIRNWEFIPKMSKGSLSDQITNINVVALTVGNMIKQFTKDNPIYNKIINKVISVEEKSMYVTKSVKELLFDGYEDSFLKILKTLKPIIKIDIPFDKFAWFYNRNNSADYDGVFNMNTGAISMSELGILSNWNYQKTSKSYSGACSAVSGTSGELWPYDASQKAEAEIFATDICSSIKLTSTKSDKVVESVSGRVFVGESNVFDNGAKDPLNSCYCTNSNFACPPPGARDVSTCRFGAPAFISYPHFYLADESYTKNVSGLNPNFEKHHFYLVLEQATSIPIEVHGRLQINILSSPIKGLDFFKNLRTTYFPMVWFDQWATISPNLAGDLKNLNFLSSYLEFIFISVAGLGFALVAIGLLLWGRRLYLQTLNQNDSLLQSDSGSTESS